MPRTIQFFLTQGRAALESALSLGSATARTEVLMLLQQALNVTRTHLLARPEQVLDGAQAAAYRALLQRRLAGEPIAYIVGEREFYGLMFKVTAATLIPRPETELLVELALQRIPPFSPGPAATLSRERGCGRGFRVLDLGAGCGALALAIAHARPDVEGVAVDASIEALAVARENARRLNIENVSLLQSDWFSAFDGQRFDLIVSNPPYIAEGDPHLAQGDLRFEPRAALASGADGLADIRRIVAQAKAHLDPGGWLLFEHGYDQAAPARELLRQAGYGEVFSARDLAGIERASGGRG
ncbi:MAG: release factor glutamine methyltransferase [Gallionellaceae bacterium]|nr:MAG: release factor glutamine methyltransferase [Gallionellaceae bacterium]